MASRPELQAKGQYTRADPPALVHQGAPPAAALSTPGSTPPPPAKMPAAAPHDAPPPAATSKTKSASTHPTRPSAFMLEKLAMGVKLEDGKLNDASRRVIAHAGYIALEPPPSEHEVANRVILLPLHDDGKAPIWFAAGTYGVAGWIHNFDPSGVAHTLSVQEAPQVGEELAWLSDQGPVTLLGYSQGGARVLYHAQEFPEYVGETWAWHPPGIPGKGHNDTVHEMIDAGDIVSRVGGHHPGVATVLTAPAQPDPPLFVLGPGEGLPLANEAQEALRAHETLLLHEAWEADGAGVSETAPAADGALEWMRRAIGHAIGWRDDGTFEDWGE